MATSIFPTKGINLDIEWLNDEDFKEPDLILPAGSVFLPDEEEDEKPSTILKKRWQEGDRAM